VYTNGVSQPSRSVEWFCQINNIPYEPKLVEVLKGEHRTPEYALINPMKKIPAIVDGDTAIFESHAILRYLAGTRKVTDHWYPQDLLKRTRVDQYLDWHHLGLRKPLSELVFMKYLAKRMGIDVPAEAVSKAEKDAQTALNIVDRVWLQDGKQWLTNNEVSIADLLAYGEIVQMRLTGLDIGNRPNLKAWMTRMEALPGYERVHKMLNKVVDMTAKKAAL